MLNVGIVGFYLSGSSALVDLLKEFEGVGIALYKDAHGKQRPFEHVPFVTSGGLFDCVTLLENSPSIYQSDMIINNFIKANERLYYNNFGSFGSYKWLIGDDFLKLSKVFLRDIGASLDGGMTSEHKIGVRFSIVFLALQIAARIVYNKPIYKLGKKNITDGRSSYWAAPDKEKLYGAAKRYINGYFKLCYQDDKSLMIFDQIIRPQNTAFLENIFDSNFKAIIVKRDARDIFYLSKYFVSKPPYSFWNAPLPTDVDLFCNYWKNNTKFKSSYNNLYVLQFEDLIYNYEQTVEELCSFLDLSLSKHQNKKRFFNPELSINNTQTFYENKTTIIEAKKIEQLIPECIYNFPYKRKPNKNKIFDNPKETKR